MITPPKVRLYSRNSFQDGWGSGEEVVFYPSGQIPPSATFIEIYEYDGIRIEFVDGNPGDRLIFDHFESDEEMQIGPGDQVTIIETKDTLKMPPPAYYALKVVGPSGVWESLYIVKPKHLKWEYIHALRMYLEERVNGITYDLIRRRSGMWAPQDGQTPFWFNLYKHFLENMNMVRRTVDLILTDPLNDISRVYREQTVSKRPDRKSLRWQARKGLSKNPTPHALNRFYEKRTELTVDIPENRWLVWFLNFLQRKLNDLFYIRFVAWEKDKFQEVENGRVELKRIEDELASIDRMYYKQALSKRMSDLKNKREAARQELFRKERELERITGYKSELSVMLSFISSVLHASWLAGVTMPNGTHAPVLKLRKDARYAALYRIYLNLREKLTRETSTRKQTYPYHGTAKLMEAFVLCLVCELLQDNGWEWESGWVAGFGAESPTFQELASGEILIFQKQGWTLEVQYDKKIAKHVAESHVGFEAQHQDCPDLLISLYDEQRVFQKAFVIEVKHRKYAYLVHPQAKDESTHVSEQLKGYTHLFYHCPHRNDILRDAIEKVICVYPQQDAGHVHEIRYRNKIHLIQLMPYGTSLDEVFGLDELRKEVLGFLNKYISA